MPEPEQLIHLDGTFRVGEWLVDARANELSRDSDTLRLEPKVMRVLCLLAARPGRVVSREELEACAWPRMVVTTDALTGAIIKLRKALGDEVRRPRYIETVSKSGYRLIASVDRAALEARETPSATAPRRRHRRPILIVLLGAAAAGLWILATDHTAPPLPPTAADRALQHKPGIAVLPLENLGADPKQEYFSDGLTEDLITDLSKLSGLRVVARNSALAYKDSRKDERVIARELGVGYLLKGSVQRSAERIRLNVRLIDVNTSANLWAERYDRQIDDLFAVQDEVAEQIVSALERELPPVKRPEQWRQHGTSIEAYDEFLRGLDYYGRRSRGDTESAIRHYERAIAIDPGFARAYAGLALVYTRDVVDGWELTARDALEQAAALTAKASSLDPSVPQIYFVEGQIELLRRNYDSAIRKAEHAISINPSYADGYALLAWILHFAGRPIEGLARMEQAVRLNPRVPAVYRLVRGALWYSSGQVEKAMVDLEAAAEVSPSYQLLRTWLAAAYAAAGRLDDAEWQAQEILALDPTFSRSRVAQVLPIRDPDYLKRFVGDLGRAGLPD